MNFAVRQPFADRELKVENFRFLKERPSLPPDPVITSAIPSEAVPRAGRPFVVEAVVRNFGTLPAEHLRFSFDGLPDGVKPLDTAALAPAESLPGSNGEESLNHDCGPQLPHERVFKFRLDDLGAGKHVFGLSVSADGVAPRRIEVVADVKPSLNLPRLDYPAEPKPVDTAPYTVGALMFPGWVNHKWHAVWSHDHGATTTRASPSSAGTTRSRPKRWTGRSSTSSRTASRSSPCAGTGATASPRGTTG